MPFYRGGGRRALPSMAFRRPGAAQMGLLSDELWPVAQLVSAEGGSTGRQRSLPRDEAVDTGADDQPIETGSGDEPTGLPESVINLYREKLDQAGQDYLAHGPRTFEEQLAYAQQVLPNAYRRTPRASDEDQLRFRQSRYVDWANHFVGPDGFIYVRDGWLGEEKPEARIFRAYEKMVGGFKRPKLDDLLAEFDLPDPLEGISPETKAKLAEVEPPISADEAAWRAWARKQEVNPDTWFRGERRPDWDQTGYWFSDSRDLAPVWGTSLFVGPDGFVYRQNDQTRPDRATEVSAALEELWAKEALRDAPPEEVYDRALVSGLLFPGSSFGRAYPTGTSYGRGSAPWVRGPTWQTPRVQEVLRALRRWGRLGNATTRALNAQLARLGESKLWKHTGGATNAGGRREKETYIPNPLRDFDMDGRKGSNYVDVTHEGPDGKVTYTQTMTVDPKTLKATIEELDTLLKIRNRVGGNVIGVLKPPPKD